MPAIATQVQVPSRPVVIDNDIAPFHDSEATTMLGIPLVENPDPILKYLAMSDESTYRMMVRAEPVLYSEIGKRTDTLLSPGWVVQPGPSESENALKLQRFASKFIRQIRKFHTVMEEMLQARYWGWRPMFRSWRTDLTFDGQPAWFVSEIREKRPEQFRFTVDGDLAYIGRDRFADPTILKTKYGARTDWFWWTLTSGSTDNPYGAAILRDLWLIWFIKSRYTEAWSTGMFRSMGILKASESLEGVDKVTGEPGASSGKTFDEAQAELLEVVDHLNANNILIQKDGWIIDFLNNVSFSEGWREPLLYSDNMMAMAISTEPHSMRSGQIGSRAALETTRKSLIDRAKSDGKWLEDEIDGMLELGINLNFGAQPDEDMPGFRMQLGKRAEMEEIMQVANLGAPVDLRAVSQQRHIPLVLESPDQKVVAERFMDVQRNDDPEVPDPGNRRDQRVPQKKLPQKD